MVACESLEYRLLEPWIKEKKKEKRERDRPRVYEHDEPIYTPLPKKEEVPKRGVIKIGISTGEEDNI